jgi:hypothetical protein
MSPALMCSPAGSSAVPGPDAPSRHPWPHPTSPLTPTPTPPPQHPTTRPGFGNTFRLARHANAYMLVYVRESEWDAVMCQVSEEDISAHVQARLKVGLDFPLWGSRLPCMRTASLCMSAAGSHAHGQPCSRGPLRTSCAEGLLHSAWPWDAAEPLVRRV